MIYKVQLSNVLSGPDETCIDFKGKSVEWMLKHVLDTLWVAENIIYKLKYLIKHSNLLTPNGFTFLLSILEVLVLLDFEATMPDELTVCVGDVVKNVSKAKEEGWLEGDLRGKRGIFPGNFAKVWIC